MKPARPIVNATKRLGWNGVGCGGLIGAQGRVARPGDDELQHLLLARLA